MLTTIAGILAWVAAIVVGAIFAVGALVISLLPYILMVVVIMALLKYIFGRRH